MQGRAHHATLIRGETLIYHFLGFVQAFKTAIFLQTSFQNYAKDS